MNLTFLKGALPLTKTITKVNNKLIKDGYPNLSKFTSTTVEVETLGDFYKALTTHGLDGSCLLKGTLSQPLVNEPRKGMMPANAATQWLCLDLDKAPFSSAEEFMRAIPALSDVSYVVQYSSSYKLDPADKTLSAHIYVLLDGPMQPSQLKVWLMHLNMTVKVLEQHLTLSSSNNYLHWPLDITTCQNDKLIYTSAPNLINIKDPVRVRTELINKAMGKLPITSIALKPMDEMRRKAATKLNQLRAVAGLDKIAKRTKIVGEFTVQPGVSSATKWELFDEDEYFRFNINGGDSKAYWCHKNDFELLHSFKGEDSMYMKEILPEVYKELLERQRLQNVVTTANGIAILHFREKRTAEYWKGTWDESVSCLELHRVRDITQLDHFLQAHGSSLGPFVPEWEFKFNPHNPAVVDTDNRVINKFVPTPYMLGKAPVISEGFPTIQKLINHAVGVGEVQEHFMNWVAVMFQKRIKIGVSWILHGVFGTGKGLLMHKVLIPLMGDYAVLMMASGLKSDFNGWRENKLLIAFDEIRNDMLDRKDLQEVLRNMITEPVININRKGVNQYDAPSFENYLFFSNDPQPVHIPLNDRRFNVASFQSMRLYLTDAEIEQIHTELGAFAEYLNNYAADANKARKIYESEERRGMQMLSMTSIEDVAHSILTGNLEKLWEYMPDERLSNEHGLIDHNATVYATLMKRYLKEGVSKITRDELAVIFKHTIGSIPEGKNKFTYYLRHNGIETKRIRSDGEITYGLSITWDIPKEVRDLLLQSLIQSAPLRRVK